MQAVKKMARDFVQLKGIIMSTNGGEKKEEAAKKVNIARTAS
jgi:hypothetical protein